MKVFFVFYRNLKRLLEDSIFVHVGYTVSFSVHQLVSYLFMMFMERRKLYEVSNSGEGDNWTDDRFLSGLKTVGGSSNNLLNHFRIASVATAPISDQFSLISLILIVFKQLHGEDGKPAQAPTGTVLTIFVLIVSLLGYYAELEKASGQWRSAILVLVLGYLLSPGLRTLTDSISTDTIYATVALAFILHLATRDYQDMTAGGGGALSLNAALFASLCLASRLSTPFQAFALLSVAVGTFSLLPAMLSSLRVRYNYLLSHIIIVTCITYVFLIYFSVKEISILFLIAIGFCNIFCPYVYVKLHKFKYNIYGPWDEAVI